LVAKIRPVGIPGYLTADPTGLQAIVKSGLWLPQAMKLTKQRRITVRKKVEFNAHRVVRKATEVEFTTRSGKEVDFVARKKTKVPVHVKFKADVR